MLRKQRLTIQLFEGGLTPPLTEDNPSASLTSTQEEGQLRPPSPPYLDLVLVCVGCADFVRDGVATAVRERVAPALFVGLLLLVAEVVRDREAGRLGDGVRVVVAGREWDTGGEADRLGVLCGDCVRDRVTAADGVRVALLVGVLLRDALPAGVLLRDALPAGVLLRDALPAGVLLLDALPAGVFVREGVPEGVFVCEGVPAGVEV